MTVSSSRAADCHFESHDNCVIASCSFLAAAFDLVHTTVQGVASTTPRQLHAGLAAAMSLAGAAAWCLAVLRMATGSGASPFWLSCKGEAVVSNVGVIGPEAAGSPTVTDAAKAALAPATATAAPATATRKSPQQGDRRSKRVGTRSPKAQGQDGGAEQQPRRGAQPKSKSATRVKAATAPSTSGPRTRQTKARPTTAKQTKAKQTKAKHVRKAAPCKLCRRVMQAAHSGRFAPGDILKKWQQLAPLGQAPRVELCRQLTPAGSDTIVGKNGGPIRDLKKLCCPLESASSVETRLSGHGMVRLVIDGTQLASSAGASCKHELLRGDTVSAVDLVVSRVTLLKLHPADSMAAGRSDAPRRDRQDVGLC